MNLDEDLQRIFTVGAKVYHAQTKKQGRVIAKTESEVTVDFGKGSVNMYGFEEFADLLENDIIVSNSRLVMGRNDSFDIRPRKGTAPQVVEVTQPVKTPTPPVITPTISLEVGYINFSTGRFSSEPKKGYTKVEYKKAVEKVTVEVDSEMMERLRELGLV